MPGLRRTREAAGLDAPAWPCGLAEIDSDLVTGDICVELEATSPNGAIDQELATICGLPAVEEEIAGVGGGP